MSDQCFGTTSGYVPGFGAALNKVVSFGTAAPVGYSALGKMSYDDSGANDRIFAVTDNGLYEYDFGGDSWQNRGEDATYGLNTGLDNSLFVVDGDVFTKSSDQKRIMLWNGSAWSVAIYNAGFPFQEIGTDGSMLWAASSNSGLALKAFEAPSTVYSIPDPTTGQLTAGNYLIWIEGRLTAKRVLSMTRNSSNQGDGSLKWDWTTNPTTGAWTDLDATLTLDVRTISVQDSINQSGDEVAFGYLDVDDSLTWYVMVYNTSTGFDQRVSPATNQVVPFYIGDNLYCWEHGTANPDIFKWNGSSWDTLVQIPDSGGVIRGVCVRNGKAYFLGSTGLLEATLT